MIIKNKAISMLGKRLDILRSDISSFIATTGKTPIIYIGKDTASRLGFESKSDNNMIGTFEGIEVFICGDFDFGYLIGR